MASDNLTQRECPLKGEWITGDQQLERWVCGDAVHRQFTLKIVDEKGAVVETRGADECTPDFACCVPELLADEKVRRAFVAASEQDRHKFLSHFLGAALELDAKKRGFEPAKVHIAEPPPKN